MKKKHRRKMKAQLCLNAVHGFCEHLQMAMNKPASLSISRQDFEQILGGALDLPKEAELIFFTPDRSLEQPVLTPDGVLVLPGQDFLETMRTSLFNSQHAPVEGPSTLH